MMFTIHGGQLRDHRLRYEILDFTLEDFKLNFEWWVIVRKRSEMRRRSFDSRFRLLKC